MRNRIVRGSLAIGGLLAILIGGWIQWQESFLNTAYERDFVAPLHEAQELESLGLWEEATQLRIAALQAAEQNSVWFGLRLDGALLRSVHANTVITGEEATRDAFRTFVETETNRVEFEKDLKAKDRTSPDLVPLLDAVNRNTALASQAMTWPLGEEQRWKTLRSGANTMVWALYALLYSGGQAEIVQYHAAAVQMIDAARLEADSQLSSVGSLETRHTEEFLTRESTMDQMQIEQPDEGQDQQGEMRGLAQDQQSAAQSGLRPKSAGAGDQPGAPFPGDGSSPAQTGFGFLGQQGQQGAPSIGLSLLPILQPSNGVGRRPLKRGQ